MKPPRGILNPEFKWIPAARTDIRKTFARVRREQRAAAELAKATAAIVRPIKRSTT